jgi:3(or 17)beta-hydroxysteroid dehydrogenase
MGRVQGKVAIVTGGASGVGKEDVLLLAREGARVVVTDVNEEAGQALAKQIGDAALFLKHDIASEDDWKRVVASTVGHFGQLDALVNNAAILIYGSIEDCSLETWQKVQRVNSDGYFLGCKYGLQAMKEKGGSIVNMSSIAGIRGQSSFVAYGASKAAVAGLTRSVAADCRMNLIKVRCNSIHPDGILTPMITNLHKSMPAGQQSAIREKDPKQLQARFCDPKDIANLVLFLASDESKFISGAEMKIDNAYSVWGD